MHEPSLNRGAKVRMFLLTPCYLLPDGIIVTSTAVYNFVSCYCSEHLKKAKLIIKQNDEVITVVFPQVCYRGVPFVTSPVITKTFSENPNGTSLYRDSKRVLKER